MAFYENAAIKDVDLHLANSIFCLRLSLNLQEGSELFDEVFINANQFLGHLLRTLKADTIKGLVGIPVRVSANMHAVTSIGHFLDDRFVHLEPPL